MIDILGIGKLLEPSFVKHGVVRAIVFGSYAKGTATESSDIDIVIDSNGFLDGMNFFIAQAEMIKAIPIKSDIYERMEIKKGSLLESEIERYGVLVYER